MPCAPIQDSSFSLPHIPGISGFSPKGYDFNIPFPSLDLPDLTDLFNLLGMALPSGKIKPHFDPDFLNSIYAAINDLLSKFMPFLMLYKFFLPVLNLILCIIEILCSLLNPFKLARAIRRLFRRCIPEFLALFPFFAIIIMIISLLLLILALIEYLIARIIQMILIMIQNIILLGTAAQRLDNDSIVAIVKKIGDLLCYLQNLFVILGTILLFIQIIQAIMLLNFRIPPCDSQDGSDDGCCTPDVCPDFIKNNTDITKNTGNFLYYNQVGIDSGLVLPPGFPPIVSTIRKESWQFYDPNLSQSQAFINITQAYDLPVGFTKVFFPEGTSYNNTTAPSSTPYTISFRFLYNPAALGKVDPKGIRYLKAVNIIVQKPPIAGVSAFDGQTLIAPFNGTLNLVGGVMTEDDGAPILNAQGGITTLDDLFHIPVNNSGTATNNGILFSNLTYTFSINHEILVGSSLITLGCMPEVAADRDFISATLGAQFNLRGPKFAAVSAALPNVATTQACLSNAIAQFRQNVSVESATLFQTNIVQCLNDLKDQTTTALSAAISAGYDQYKSDFTIDPAIQFTTESIKVSVSLNESASQLMTSSLPVSAAEKLALNLSGVVSLGSVSSFAYDGYNFFTANITSNKAGNGTVKVAFENNFISILTNPDSIDTNPSVSVKELKYTFVDSPVIGGGDAQPRRDEGDVSRDGSDGSIS